MTATITITPTITRLPMSDADLLRLTHWLSPVFPVGGYAYSGGLETAIADGFVSSEDTLSDWLDASLFCGSARVDAVLLTSAMAEDADIPALSDWARALANSAERWRETSEQGRAFQQALVATGEGDGQPLPLPVAVGRAAQSLTLPPERVAALYLQASIANLATGAVRHVPLGQAAGSRVIARLGPRILSVASEATSTAPEDVLTTSFGADLAQMRHETQETRIFRT